ncbi:MAG TPA: TetR/AcrR family transcriptional regulator C-terminal domain-containing protein [Actinomycetota bacterium]|jgi:AcrR family transcriptional regulator|nr:TetR/AcrR family transcriptional regulator C-terminal domain-containing protein [Actinomycetota bacterium]
MATKIRERSPTREPLSRERILGTAVALADESGVDSLSMRRIAQELGVVPMALYKHVANKEELLDGLVDAVIDEIEPPIAGDDWKTTMRERILSARRALLRHPWASQVIESRAEPTPTVIGYIDSMMGIFLRGGFSVDLMHHAMHVMGSRILGFSQELFDDTASVPEDEALAMWTQMAEAYPNIATLVGAVSGGEIEHEEESIVGGGCDDQFEFEFALDLILDGLERLRERETTLARD